MYLIKPREFSVPVSDIDKEMVSQHPELSPARIPEIACIGEFESYDAARDHNHCFSALTIVWFQESFALPIEDFVLRDIQSLNWINLAHDYSP